MLTTYFIDKPDNVFSLKKSSKNVVCSSVNKAEIFIYLQKMQAMKYLINSLEYDHTTFKYFSQINYYCFK